MLLSQYQHTPRGRTKSKSSPAQVQLSHWGQRPSPPILGKTGCSFQMAGQVTYPEMPGAGPPGTTATSWLCVQVQRVAIHTCFPEPFPPESPAKPGIFQLPSPASSCYSRDPLSLVPILCPYLKSPLDVQMPRLQPRSSQAWRKATENGRDSDPEETSN